MSNWDEEDWESGGAPAPAPAVGASLGNWDDEDLEEEEEEVVVKKPSAPMKPSKARALALKAKEEEENRLEAERILAREKELSELDAIERKMREQQIVEEADLENTRDLFMDGGAGKDGMKPPAEPTLDNYKPVTDADFKKFAGMISDRCCELNDNPRRTLRYVSFAKDVMRGLCRDLGPDDTKDLATFMGLLSNEKRDEFKKAKGLNKKRNNKKAHVRVDRAADMREDKFDDFADDFM